MQPCKRTLNVLVLLLHLFLRDVLSLKDVVLTIEPKIVQRLHNSTLRCTYDLQGATLYSVKWYRGTYEFYRYTPTLRPHTKVFPFSGIRVDMNSSNSTQVVLTDIEFKLAGNFSCEVTTTEEPAATGTDVASMQVVQLPDYPPTISVGREPLDTGDILRANCTSPPARPAAMLKFILNGMTVIASEPLTPRKAQETSWSDLALELVLQDYHFDDGRLILRCVAQIGDYYHEQADLELESSQEPVPERVSAVDSASFPSTHTVLQVFLFSTLLLVIKS